MVDRSEAKNSVVRRPGGARAAKASRGGWKQSPEAREKIAAAMRRRRESPEGGAKFTAGLVAIWQDPIYREKQRQRLERRSAARRTRMQALSPEERFRRWMARDPTDEPAWLATASPRFYERWSAEEDRWLLEHADLSAPEAAVILGRGAWSVRRRRQVLRQAMTRAPVFRTSSSLSSESD